MNIAILGYGKMGKEIEKILIERNHEVTLRTTSKNSDFNLNDLKDIDVAIEFSTPKTAKDNILKCIESSTPIIVGTTGEWLKDLDIISELVKKNNTAMLHASNFSIGVNIFFKVNDYLAKLMNNFPNYKVSMEEIHHTQKLDSPSGTAISLANQIIYNHKEYKGWSEEKKEKNIKIISKRVENVPGTHTINYENNIDKIEITHTAKNRKGFALGAVIAAEWIVGKKGVYTMNDVLQF